MADPDILDREDEDEQPRPVRSITGMAPIARAAQPARSITGMEPLVPPKPMPAAMAAPAMPTATVSGPNVSQDILSGTARFNTRDLYRGSKITPQDVLAGSVPPPRWQDYKPQHVGVGRKILAGLGAAAEAATTRNLPASIGAYHSIAEGPQREEFGEATQEYKDLLGQGQLAHKDAADELEAELKRSEAERNTAEAEKDRRPPEAEWVDVPNTNFQMERHSGQTRPIQGMAAPMTKQEELNQQEEAARRLEGIRQGGENARNERTVSGELQREREIQAAEDKRAKTGRQADQLDKNLANVEKDKETKWTQIQSKYETLAAQNWAGKLHPEQERAMQQELQQVQDAYEGQLKRFHQTVTHYDVAGGTAAGGGTAKTLSRDAIQRAAKDHGISEQEAEKQARAAGYTIQ